jgi:predicted glycosyltransferase
MNPKKRLLFYCQHVLGMGHFIRSTEIVRGLSDFDVTFLNGGEIVPGFDLPASVEVVNLPPIKSDNEFRGLQAASGEHSLEEIKAIRTEKILAEYNRVQPDVLVIELFPFGRPMAGQKSFAVCATFWSRSANSSSLKSGFARS